MRTTRSGSENGRPRRKRSWIKLKMAVFMPIPSASVSTASAVNPGDLRSWRRAKRTSFMSCGVKISFCAKSDYGVDARGTARGNPRSKKCCGEKKRADSEINFWIDVFDFEKHVLQCA